MTQRLWRLRLLVALGILVAAFLAVATNYDIKLSSSHPLRAHASTFGAAQTVMYVDSPRSSIVTPFNDFQTLTSRAQVLARLVNSDDVKGYVAQRLGIGIRDITVDGPFPDQPGAAQTEPVAQQRANQVLSQGGGYSVLVDTEQSVPTITVYAQAPNGATAVRLASAVVSGLRHYVSDLTKSARPTELRRANDAIAALSARRDQPLSKAERRQQRDLLLDKGTVIRTTGPAVGGDVRDQSGKLVVVLVFVAVLLAWCVALLVVDALVRTARRRPAAVR